MQKCCNRDAEIVSLVNTHAVLCTEQIAALSFGGKYPLLTCRKRLRSLVEHNRLVRKRFAPYASNVYSVESWPKQWEHQLGVNWVYCWLKMNLKAGESLYHWQAPYVSTIKPDAFWGIKSQTHSFGFLELDCNTNPFEKIHLYGQYYKDAAYQSEWWAGYASRFPKVLIVTETQARANRILHSVATENPHGLTFEVRLLGQLRSQVISRLHF